MLCGWVYFAWMIPREEMRLPQQRKVIKQAEIIQQKDHEMDETAARRQRELQR